MTHSPAVWLVEVLPYFNRLGFLIMERFAAQALGQRGFAALAGADQHQAIEWSPMAIDTPGEYLENRCLYSALLTSACEADVIALVLNADAQWSPFSPGFTAPMNRPTIGLVTKADLADAQRISLIGEWLRQAGAQQIFITSALNNLGLDAVLDFLNSKEPLCLTK